VRISLTYNLRRNPTPFQPTDCYAEWDEPETIAAVYAALCSENEVTLVEANENIFSTLNRTKPDFVFNIAEGLHSSSRESLVPALCDMLEVPYTGSGPFTLSACLDKSRAKQILGYFGIPTPGFSIVANLNGDVDALEPPVILKPLWEGSSKGIRNDSVAWDHEVIREKARSLIAEYDQPVIAEKFIRGREFTVALIGNGDSLRVLPIVEIMFDTLPAGANPIYSYEAKWVWDKEEDPLDIFACPADITDGERRAIEDVCTRAFRALGCRDWCRIDVRMDEKGIPNIIELNPLPGILPDPASNSCFPKAARAAGLSYDELILTVLGEAMQRYAQSCAA
jgi:D-alanine-D-alanine ligase